MSTAFNKRFNYSATCYKQRIEIFLVSRPLICFHNRGRYHIETSPLICSANQWTGFYMISTSVMKGLKISQNASKIFALQCFFIDCLKYKTVNKQLADHPQKILGKHVHISWKTLQLVWLLFEAFRIF